MSTFIQEVLGLLQSGRRKTTFKPTRDYIEFGRLGPSTLNTGTSYAPKMEAFTMRMDDFIIAMGDSDTTYDLNSSTIGSDVGINLVPSSGSTDVVVLEAGTNITLTNAGTNRITIDATGGITSVIAATEDRYKGVIVNTVSGVATVGISPTALVSLGTTIAAEDLFYVQDDPTGLPINKKVSWSEMITGPGNIATLTAGANISLAFSGINNTTVEVSSVNVVNSIKIGSTTEIGNFEFTGTGLTLTLTSGTPNIINFGVDYLGSDNVVESAPLATNAAGSDWLLWGDSSNAHDVFRSTLNSLFAAYAKTSPLTQVAFRADATGLISGGGAVDGRFGAVTVVYTATGEWTVSWTQSTLDVNYQIMVYNDDAPGTNNSYVSAKTTSSFKIHLIDAASAPIAGSINVTIKR